LDEHECTQLDERPAVTEGNGAAYFQELIDRGKLPSLTRDEAVTHALADQSI
jgi:hypothetical protein